MIEKKYLTAEECGTYLGGRTPGAIRNLVLRGHIPYRKAGGRLVFIRKELDAWIEGAPGRKIKDLDQ